MKNKLITAIAGIAILFGVVCSGIIITQGIQQNETSHSQAANTKREPIRAWELEKTKLDEFTDIAITLSYCDLFIVPGDSYYLEYRMDGSCEEPEYGVTGSRFYFQEGPTQLKYRTGFHLFFNPGYSSANREPFYVNLYVPKKQYFNLLQLSSESGNIELGDIQAKDIDIHAEYGDITADGFKAANRASIKLESGNLTLSRLETDSFILSNKYGNCSMDEITVKQSEIAIESGSLKLHGATLGTTEITNEYGDVTLNLANKVSDYNYDLNASYGTIKLDGKTLPSDEDGTSRYQKDNGKELEIIIGSDSGDITIR